MQATLAAHSYMEQRTHALLHLCHTLLSLHFINNDGDQICYQVARCFSMVHANTLLDVQNAPVEHSRIRQMPTIHHFTKELEGILWGGDQGDWCNKPWHLSSFTTILFLCITLAKLRTIDYCINATTRNRTNAPMTDPGTDSSAPLFCCDCERLLGTV